MEKYTKEILQSAVNNSRSLRQVVINLQANPHGSMVAHIKNRIKKYNIDISHFSGQSWSKGKLAYNKLEPNKILTNNIFRPHHQLKRALIEIGIKHECQVCKIKEWNSKPLNLQIDHIHGNNTNNNKDNLRFICPNCHSQTDNFCAKNIRRNGRIGLMHQS